MKKIARTSSLVASSAIAASALVLAAGPVNAGSVAGTGGSTEITQIMNNAELINQAAYQAQMVQNQLRQLQTLGQIPWSNAASTLTNLINVVRSSQTIAWQLAGADQQFRQVYDYTRAALPGTNTYSDRYRNWTNNSMNGITGAMQSAGLQTEQFATEQQALSSLKSLSTSPTGQVQAIQAGNAIAAMQVEQIQELRQLHASQIQMQGAYFAQQVGERQNSREAERQFFRSTP